MADLEMHAEVQPEVKLNFDSLKHDVATLQSCISELLPTVGKIHASSWRFPEICSSEVNTKKLLDKIAYSEDEKKFTATRTLLMELTIDRLVFLIQCTFKLLECCGDEQSNVVPLTLGSAVRKLTKQALRASQNFTAIKQQLDKKNEVIAKLQSNIKVLEKDNTLLQEALSKAVSKVEKAEVVKEVYVKSPLQYVPVADCKPAVESVAVQTTETAFALCANCVSIQKCLLSCSTMTSQLCTSLSVDSTVAEKDFKFHIEETGRIDHTLWLALSQRDVKSVQGAVSKLQQLCHNLKSELFNKEQEVMNLTCSLNVVNKEFIECKNCFDAAKRQHATDITDLSSKYEAKFNHLNQLNSKLLQDIDTIEAKVIDYRIRETQFKKEIDSAKRNQSRLEEKLACAKSEMLEQKKKCLSLQEGIRIMTDELQSMKIDVQEKIYTLKKVETQNNSLVKRDKTMQSKQLTLLTKIDQLGQECSSLKTELSTALHGKNEMSYILSGLEQKCNILQQQLVKEEQRAKESLLSQKSLLLTVESLGNQLEDIRSELEHEKEKCLLLMDYPSLNAADPNYKECLKLLEYDESQNHLSANIIRIMLLEDQNKDLRKLALLADTKEEPTFKLNGPIPLWNDSLLRKMKQEYKKARKTKQHQSQNATCENDDVVLMDIEKTSPSMQDHSSPTTKQSGVQSRSSSGRTKGSIGRLMSALNESKLIAPPNSFVTLHDHD